MKTASTESEGSSMFDESHAEQRLSVLQTTDLLTMHHEMKVRTWLLPYTIIVYIVYIIYYIVYYIKQRQLQVDRRGGSCHPSLTLSLLFNIIVYTTLNYIILYYIAQCTILLYYITLFYIMLLLCYTFSPLPRPETFDDCVQ